MTLAKVNDHEAAKRFFSDYNIPYEVISKGPNAGKLRVKPIRDVDSRKAMEVKRRLCDAGLEIIFDHGNVFRDAEDNTIVTLNPYDIDLLPPHIDWIEISDHSIYGFFTKTFVVRCLN